MICFLKYHFPWALNFSRTLEIKKLLKEERLLIILGISGRVHGVWTAFIFFWDLSDWLNFLGFIKLLLQFIMLLCMFHILCLAFSLHVHKMRWIPSGSGCFGFFAASLGLPCVCWAFVDNFMSQNVTDHSINLVMVFNFVQFLEPPCLQVLIGWVLIHLELLKIHENISQIRPHFKKKTGSTMFLHIHCAVCKVTEIPGSFCMPLQAVEQFCFSVLGTPQISSRNPLNWTCNPQELDRQPPRLNPQPSKLEWQPINWSGDPLNCQIFAMGIEKRKEGRNERSNSSGYSIDRASGRNFEINHAQTPGDLLWHLPGMCHCRVNWKCSGSDWCVLWDLCTTYAELKVIPPAILPLAHPLCIIRPNRYLSKATAEGGLTHNSDGIKSGVPFTSPDIDFYLFEISTYPCQKFLEKLGEHCMISTVRFEILFSIWPSTFFPSNYLINGFGGTIGVIVYFLKIIAGNFPRKKCHYILKILNQRTWIFFHIFFIKFDILFPFMSCFFHFLSFYFFHPFNYFHHKFLDDFLKYYYMNSEHILWRAPERPYMIKNENGMAMTMLLHQNLQLSSSITRGPFLALAWHVPSQRCSHSLGLNWKCSGSDWCVLWDLCTTYAELKVIPPAILPCQVLDSDFLHFLLNIERTVTVDRKIMHKNPCQYLIIPEREAKKRGLNLEVTGDLQIFPQDYYLFLIRLKTSSRVVPVFPWTFFSRICPFFKIPMNTRDFLHFLLNIERTVTFDVKKMHKVPNEHMNIYINFLCSLGPFYLVYHLYLPLINFLPYLYNSIKFSWTMFPFFKIPMNTLIQLKPPVTCLNECLPQKNPNNPCSQVTLEYFYSTFCEFKTFFIIQKKSQTTHKISPHPQNLKKYSFHPLFIFFSTFNLKFSTLGIIQILINFKKGEECCGLISKNIFHIILICVSRVVFMSGFSHSLFISPFSLLTSFIDQVRFISLVVRNNHPIILLFHLLSLTHYHPRLLCCLQVCFISLVVSPLSCVLTPQVGNLQIFLWLDLIWIHMLTELSFTQASIFLRHCGLKLTKELISLEELPHPHTGFSISEKIMTAIFEWKIIEKVVSTEWCPVKLMVFKLKVLRELRRSQKLEYPGLVVFYKPGWACVFLVPSQGYRVVALCFDLSQVYAGVAMDKRFLLLLHVAMSQAILCLLGPSRCSIGSRLILLGHLDVLYAYLQLLYLLNEFFILYFIFIFIIILYCDCRWLLFFYHIFMQNFYSPVRLNEVQPQNSAVKSLILCISHDLRNIGDGHPFCPSINASYLYRKTRLVQCGGYTFLSALPNRQGVSRAYPSERKSRPGFGRSMRLPQVYYLNDGEDGLFGRGMENPLHFRHPRGYAPAHEQDQWPVFEVRSVHDLEGSCTRLPRCGTSRQHQDRCWPLLMPLLSVCRSRLRRLAFTAVVHDCRPKMLLGYEVRNMSDGESEIRKLRTECITLRYPTTSPLKLFAFHTDINPCLEFHHLVPYYLWSDLFRSLPYIEVLGWKTRHLPTPPPS
ncbi:hypothetical protein VP01_265g3 [Puccinia sorghi]|uniref:Uncharacterized protein n=1 Tax=Puccinia sorghi TaxID=27349 RepID=A0A0L6V404_9BASI|nr:hypothetical protein VP01_265g3 [Puccinia sorghi]